MRVLPMCFKAIRFLLIIFLFLLFPLMAGAQEYHRTDTLPGVAPRAVEGKG